jgi:hypothetical protein
MNTTAPTGSHPVPPAVMVTVTGWPLVTSADSIRVSSPSIADMPSASIAHIAETSTRSPMGVRVDESRQLVDAATGTDPEVGLTAVVALRQLVEVLEVLQVDNARAQGWSWRDITRRLGVTKQAVHYKHGLRTRRRASCETD